MAVVKTTTTKTTPVNNTPLFGKENYMWMLAGLVVLAIGFFLMAGGKSTDPTVFNESDVYSPVRITVAPLLIVAGFILEIVGLMKKPKTVA
jgi:hypothetical protein